MRQFLAVSLAAALLMLPFSSFSFAEPLPEAPEGQNDPTISGQLPDSSPVILPPEDSEPEFLPVQDPPPPTLPSPPEETDPEKETEMEEEKDPAPEEDIPVSDAEAEEGPEEDAPVEEDPDITDEGQEPPPDPESEDVPGNDSSPDPDEASPTAEEAENTVPAHESEQLSVLPLFSAPEASKGSLPLAAMTVTGLEIQGEPDTIGQLLVENDDYHDPLHFQVYLPICVERWETILCCFPDMTAKIPERINLDQCVINCQTLTVDETGRILLFTITFPDESPGLTPAPGALYLFECTAFDEAGNSWIKGCLFTLQKAEVPPAPAEPEEKEEEEKEEADEDAPLPDAPSFSLTAPADVLYTDRSESLFTLDFPAALPEGMQKTSPVLYRADQELIPLDADELILMEGEEGQYVHCTAALQAGSSYRLVLYGETADGLVSEAFCDFRVVLETLLLTADRTDWRGGETVTLTVDSKREGLSLQFDGIQPITVSPGQRSGKQTLFTCLFADSGETTVRALCAGTDLVSNALTLSLSDPLPPMGMVNITSPENNSAVARRDVYVRWDPLAEAVSYSLQVQDRTAGTSVLSLTGLLQTEYTLPDLESRHAYRITVTATDRYGRTTVNTADFSVNLSKPKFTRIRVTPSSSGYRSTKFTFTFDVENTAAVAIANRDEFNSEHPEYLAIVPVQDGKAQWSISSLAVGSHHFLFVGVNEDTVYPQYVTARRTLTVRLGKATWDIRDSFNGVDYLGQVQETYDMPSAPGAVPVPLDRLMTTVYRQESLPEDWLTEADLRQVWLLRTSSHEYGLLLADASGKAFHLGRNTAGHPVACFLQGNALQYLLTCGNTPGQLCAVSGGDKGSLVYYDRMELSSLFSTQHVQQLLHACLSAFASGSLPQEGIPALLAEILNLQDAGWSALHEVMGEAADYRCFMHPARSWSSDIPR